MSLSSTLLPLVVSSDASCQGLSTLMVATTIRGYGIMVRPHARGHLTLLVVALALIQRLAF